MTLELDHLIVPAKDQRRAARELAELLDVRWSETAPLGPFSPVTDGVENKVGAITSVQLPNGASVVLK